MSTSPCRSSIAAYPPSCEEQTPPRLYSFPSARETKNTIRFKCGACARQMEARVQDGGADTNCPHCNAPITVPRILANPFLRPIKTLVGEIKAVPFPFPYLPQLVQLAVMVLVLSLFAVLFITIGLISQVAGALRGLILDARKHLHRGSPVERSAQGISIAIYWLLWLPCAIIQLPFSFLGSLWGSRRVVALASFASLLLLIDALTIYFPQIARLLQSL